MTEQSIAGVAAIAAKMAKAQRECGDVLDRLPCIRCKATTLRGCTVDYWSRVAASELINKTPGLHALLISQTEERRNHLISQGADHDR